MYIEDVDSKRINHVFAEQFAKTSFQIPNKENGPSGREGASKGGVLN